MGSNTQFYEPAAQQQYQGIEHYDDELFKRTL